MNSARKDSWIVVALTLAMTLAWASGCERSHVSMGSESHFLMRCVSNAACGPLSCVGGVCTEPCKVDDECTGLAPGSTCVSQQPSAAVAQACGIACGREATICATQDVQLSCRDARCLPAPITTPNDTPELDAGTAIAGGGGALAVPSDDEQAGDPSTINGLRDCGIHTAFPGDEACLPAPLPELGVQIHLGPARYDDPAEIQMWKLEPGDEVSDCFELTMPNTHDATFAEWEFSARQGLHHAAYGVGMENGQLIVCDQSETGSPPLPRAGMLVSELPRIARRPTAEGAIPELTSPANAPALAAMHSYNFTDQSLLREAWLNLYLANPSNASGVP